MREKLENMLETLDEKRLEVVQILEKIEPNESELIGDMRELRHRLSGAISTLNLILGQDLD